MTTMVTKEAANHCRIRIRAPVHCTTPISPFLVNASFIFTLEFFNRFLASTAKNAFVVLPSFVSSVVTSNQSKLSTDPPAYNARVARHHPIPFVVPIRFLALCFLVYFDLFRFNRIRQLHAISNAFIRRLPRASFSFFANKDEEDRSHKPAFSINDDVVKVIVLPALGVVRCVFGRRQCNRFCYFSKTTLFFSALTQEFRVSLFFEKKRTPSEHLLLSSSQSRERERERERERDSRTPPPPRIPLKMSSAVAVTPGAWRKLRRQRRRRSLWRRFERSGIPHWRLSPSFSFFHPPRSFVRFLKIQNATHHSTARC